MSAPVLELYKLSKTYPSPIGPAVIVKDFTLNFAAGEFITLIGHSGCGKSTVLSMVAGLTDITDGAMILGTTAPGALAGDWGKAPVDKTPIEECVDLGGEFATADADLVSSVRLDGGEAMVLTLP